MKKFCYIVSLIILISPLSHAEGLGSGIPGYTSSPLGSGLPGQYGRQSDYSQRNSYSKNQYSNYSNNYNQVNSNYSNNYNNYRSPITSQFNLKQRY